MAPQQPAKPQRQIQPLTANDRLDNDDAQIGAAEDLAAGGNELAPLDQGAGSDPLGGGVESRKPIQRSPQDDVRGQISARFRRAEPEEERPFNGDLNDQENLYGEFGQEGDPAPGEDESIVGSQDEPPAKPVPQQTPTTRKIKVRGKEVELSDEDILAAAQKTLAGDSYMEEARALLDAAKEIRGERTAPTRQHPDGTNSTQPEPDAHGPVDPAQHPEPSLRDVVEKIQFGDPEEAAALLETAIDQRAEKKATKGQLERVFNQDLARSQQALKKFQEANTELANDEDFAILMEANMYRLYQEDIKKLGLTDAQIPKNKVELANWHRFYRVNGYEVRQTKDLLETSKTNVLKKMGRADASAPSGKPQQQQQRKEAPRIQVNVDRDARRQQIPLQPQRSVTPRRDATGPAVRTGSDVVAQMRRARGQV